MMQFRLITFMADKTSQHRPIVLALQLISVSPFLWQWANTQCHEW